MDGGQKTMDLFNYKTSFLNSGLKLLVPLIFLVGTIFFFSLRNKYQGEIGTVVRRLVIAGVFGILANFFRYGADIWWADLKWGESIGYVLFAAANVYAVWPLLTFGREVSADKSAAKK
jgi:hypothetical protein